MATATTTHAIAPNTRARHGTKFRSVSSIQSATHATTPVVARPASDVSKCQKNTFRATVLRADGLIVHETLAIAEFLAERFPAAHLWPAAAADRAEARAISAEMHAGFAALRDELPMNCRGRFPGRPISPAAADDIARITDIWRACRARSRDAGDFLFGHFTIADAMYAPVVSRFQTYSIDLDDSAAAYCATVHALPAMRQWLGDAAAEAEVIASAEFT